MKLLLGLSILIIFAVTTRMEERIEIDLIELNDQKVSPAQRIVDSTQDPLILSMMEAYERGQTVNFIQRSQSMQKKYLADLELAKFEIFRVEGISLARLYFVPIERKSLAKFYSQKEP